MTTKNPAGGRLQQHPSATRPPQTTVQPTRLETVHSHRVHPVGTLHLQRTVDTETGRRRLQQLSMAGSTADVESGGSDRDLSESILHDSAPTTGRL